MNEVYFSEIPIYRCTPEKHTEEMNKEKAHWSDLGYAEWFNTEIWYPWRYNEIIGWIRLRASDRMIKGDIWFLKAGRRIRKDLKNKKVFFRCKAFEVLCLRSESSEDIFEELCSELENFAKRPTLRSRFLDIEAFKKLGAYIDWRRLVGLT